jgi:hypothetical protein
MGKTVKPRAAGQRIQCYAVTVLPLLIATMYIVAEVKDKDSEFATACCHRLLPAMSALLLLYYCCAVCVSSQGPRVRGQNNSRLNLTVWLESSCLWFTATMQV